jgi:hypothetical protein
MSPKIRERCTRWRDRLLEFMRATPKWSDVLLVTLIVVIVIGTLALIRVLTTAQEVKHLTLQTKHLTVRNKMLAQTNHKLALQALANTRAIQRQRYDITLANCGDQNQRNRNVIAQLNLDLAGLPHTPQTDQQRAQTIALLDAAVPHRDCLSVAAKSLASTGPPIPPGVAPQAGA